MKIWETVVSFFNFWTRYVIFNNKQNDKIRNFIEQLARHCVKILQLKLVIVFPCAKHFLNYLQMDTSEHLFLIYCFVHPIFLSFCFWCFGHFSCVIFFQVFFCLAHLALKNVNKDYVIFCNFVTKYSKSKNNKWDEWNVCHETL